MMSCIAQKQVAYNKLGLAQNPDPSSWTTLSSLSYMSRRMLAQSPELSE